MTQSSSADIAFNPKVSALLPYNAGLSLGKARPIAERDDIARLASNESFEG